MSKLRRPSQILTFFVFLIAVAFTIHELNHFYRYGHLVPLRLHADVEITRESDLLGIPGVANGYHARLTNYSVLPIMMTVCDYWNSGARATMIAYIVERWDPQLRIWEFVPEWDGYGSRLFCRPSFEMSEEHLVRRQFWPGQSIPVGWVLPAERAGFHPGDGGRFTIFLDATRNTNRVISTAAFRIDRSAGK
jgi:hypothetical protein